MAYTDRELEFIDSVSDKLEIMSKGDKESLEEIIRKIPKYEHDISVPRLVLGLTYVVLGADVFAGRISNLGTVNDRGVTLEGVVYNKTTLPAKGVPLTPALFNAKTSLVFYKLDPQGNIDLNETEVYQLSTREEYRDKLKSKDPSIVILNKQSYKSIVQGAFPIPKKYAVDLFSPAWDSNLLRSVFLSADNDKSRLRLLAIDNLKMEFSNVIQLSEKMRNEIIDLAFDEKKVNWYV